MPAMVAALRIARQKEIDASIAANAEYEYLYDKPYEDNKQGARGRAVSPWKACRRTVMLGVDENDELIEGRRH